MLERLVKRDTAIRVPWRACVKAYEAAHHLILGRRRSDASRHLDAAASRAPPYHTPPQAVKPRAGSVMCEFYSS